MKFDFNYSLCLVLAALCNAPTGAYCSRDSAYSEQTLFGQGQYDSGLFSPIEDLNALGFADYSILAHPAFPKYQVRIKKSDFCDGSVRAFTGYIDIEARHLFFYFFESRNNPDTDDVIFWTNGGPGCSSSLGLLMELGPCRVSGANETIYNPHSWNEYANIFFIDQPIGVGFSYADYGESVSNSEEAAIDIAAFVAIFFEHFTSFKGRPFHMAGESYGGRYIPVYAKEVYDQNARLKEAGITPINLTSIMLGNGCVDDISMTLSYYDMQCTAKAATPVLDISTCVAIKRGLSRCEIWMKASCADTFDAINCAAATSFCTQLIMDPFDRSGYNPYDITKLCDGQVEDTLCYPITKNITAYLSQPRVQKAIGVDPIKFGNFTSCSSSVSSAFINSLDSSFPTQYYIAALLERGVRALVYVGANDWICNWVGNERMTLGMQWSGQEAFAREPLRSWKVTNDAAGLVRSTGPLTFATIYGAGHMAPYDKPKEMLDLVKGWLAHEQL